MKQRSGLRASRQPACPPSRRLQAEQTVRDLPASVLRAALAHMSGCAVVHTRGYAVAHTRTCAVAKAPCGGSERGLF